MGMEDELSGKIPAKQEQHEKFIRNILQRKFGREVLSLQSMGKGQNVIVYRVTINSASPTSSKTPEPASQGVIGVSPLPQESVQVVFRLSRPEAMLNESARVQNEIATMILTREALAAFNPSLVPDVYGWAPAGNDLGWSLIQYVPGELLSSHFPSLKDNKKREILGQISSILKEIREYQVPSSIRGYGGLTFSDEGKIINGPTTIPGGGPSPTHSALYQDYLQTQLKSADESEVIRGWRNTSVRERIDKFAKEKFLSLWDSFAPRQTLVHGDFDTWNMLFDPETSRITAIIDYDFGHIGSEADEYLYSLSQLHFLVVPPFEADENIDFMRRQLLQGWKHGEAAARPKCESVDWKLAILMDEQLARAGVERPSDISAMDELSARYWFMQSISPPILSVKSWRDAVGSEQVEKFRQREQGAIERYLERWGY